MGTSEVVAYAYARRIEDKVGGNRQRLAINCSWYLSFSEEKKVRFSIGEVVLHRWEIKIPRLLQNGK